MNERPASFSDSLLLKTALERWPIRTWLSAKERVLYQFKRMHEMSAESEGALNVVRSRTHLDDIFSQPPKVHAILAVEGLSCLESDIEAVNQLFRAGARILYVSLSTTTGIACQSRFSYPPKNSLATYLEAGAFRFFFYGF